MPFSDSDFMKIIFKNLFNDPNKPPVISALNITTHLGGILDSTASGAL